MNRYFYVWRGFKPSPQQQAFYFLQFGLFLVLLIEGADKFFNVLVEWTQYLPGVILYNTPLNSSDTMKAVGIVEVITAIMIMYHPKWGGYLSSAIFAAIVLSLAMIPGYYNIMVVDFGLFCASLALAKLSK